MSYIFFSSRREIGAGFRRKSGAGSPAEDAQKLSISSCVGSISELSQTHSLGSGGSGLSPPRFSSSHDNETRENTHNKYIHTGACFISIHLLISEKKGGGCPKNSGKDGKMSIEFFNE
jgi:hypothetical protein